MFIPMVNKHRVQIKHSRFKFHVVVQGVHFNGKFPIPVSKRGVIQLTTKQHAIRCVRKSRFGPGSLTQGDIYRFQDQQRKQTPASRKKCGRKNLHQKPHSNQTPSVNKSLSIYQVGNVTSREIFINCVNLRIDFTLIRRAANIYFQQAFVLALHAVHPLFQQDLDKNLDMHLYYKVEGVLFPKLEFLPHQPKCHCHLNHQ